MFFGDVGLCYYFAMLDAEVYAKRMKAQAYRQSLDSELVGIYIKTMPNALNSEDEQTQRVAEMFTEPAFRDMCLKRAYGRLVVESRSASQKARVMTQDNEVISWFGDIRDEVGNMVDIRQALIRRGVKPIAHLEPTYTRQEIKEAVKNAGDLSRRLDRLVTISGLLNIDLGQPKSLPFAQYSHK